MAIGIVHEIPGGTQDDYDKIAKALGQDSFDSLSDWPVEGILCHIAGPYEGGWRVVDVWESEEAFQAFGEKLMPAIQEAGIDAPPPEIYSVHNFVA